MATISLSQGLKTLGLRPLAGGVQALCDLRARKQHRVFRLIWASKVAVIHQTLASFDINHIGNSF